MSSAPSKLLIVTTDTIDGKTCTPIAPILVAYCLSKSLLGDMTANVKNWSTGGELRGYSDMLEQTGSTVLQRMAEKAKAIEADAVIGVRLVTSNVAEGAAELIGYGTAVRMSDRKPTNQNQDTAVSNEPNRTT